MTALLFTVGKFLIGLYIGKSGSRLEFRRGRLAGRSCFVWVYYSAQIFLMGAEFTWVYARTFGSMREQAKAGDGPPRQHRRHPRPSRRPPSPARSAARPAGRASARKPLADVVLGVVAMLALRYLVPRILRRM